MPICITCPCGAKLRAPDAAAGKTVSCPKCKGRLTVPLRVTAVEEVEECPIEDFDESPSRRRKASKRRGFPVWVILIIALIPAGVCGIILLFVALDVLDTSSSTSSPDTAAGSNQTVERKAAKGTKEDGYTNAVDFLDHPEKYKDKRVTLPAQVEEVYPEQAGTSLHLLLRYRHDPEFSFWVFNVDNVKTPNVQPGNWVRVTFISVGLREGAGMNINRIVNIERLSESE